MKIGIRVLGSSSAGNCTLVWDNNTSILIDCGFEPEYILSNMDKLSLDISSLAGVFITHIHGDHINKAMLRLFSRQNIPVYSHNNIRGHLLYRYAASKRVYNHSLFHSYTNNEIQLGDFTISGFEIPHDSRGGCFGYNISKKTKNGIRKISIATDIGFPEERLIKHFINSDLIVIESNHDIDMLNNSGRSEFLIQRIKEIGHLSNKECAELLNKIFIQSDKLPEAIILAHISQQCNTNKIAEDNIKELLSKNGLEDIKLVMSYCSKPNEIIYLD